MVPKQTTLKELMQERGVKARDLAHYCRTYEATVSRWCNGTTPNRMFRQRIVRKLQLKPEHISGLGWPDE